jgi:hypothetical protein
MKTLGIPRYVPSLRRVNGRTQRAVCREKVHAAMNESPLFSGTNHLIYQLNPNGGAIALGHPLDMSPFLFGVFSRSLPFIFLYAAQVRGRLRQV